MPDCEFATMKLPSNTKNCSECGRMPTYYIGDYMYTFMTIYCPLCAKTTAMHNMEQCTVAKVVAQWNKLNKG